MPTNNPDGAQSRPLVAAIQAPASSSMPKATALTRILNINTAPEMIKAIAEQLRTKATSAPFIYSIANYPSFLSLAQHIKSISPEYFDVFCTTITGHYDRFNLIGWALVACDAPLLQYLLCDCKMNPYDVERQPFSSISTLLVKLCASDSTQWLEFFKSNHAWLAQYIDTYNARKPVHEPRLSHPFELQMIWAPQRASNNHMNFLYQDSDDDEEEKTHSNAPMELCTLVPLACVFAMQGFECVRYLFQKIPSNWLQQLHHYDYENGYPLCALFNSGPPINGQDDWRNLAHYVSPENDLPIDKLLCALEQTILLGSKLAARPASTLQEATERASRLALSNVLSMPNVLFDLMKQMDDIATPSIQALQPEAQYIALLLLLKINHLKTIVAILATYTEKRPEKHPLLTQLLNTYVITNRLSYKANYPSHLLPVASQKTLKTLSNQFELIIKLFPNRLLLLRLINQYGYERVPEIEKLLHGLQQSPLPAALPAVRMLHPSAAVAVAQAHSAKKEGLLLTIKSKMTYIELLIGDAADQGDFSEVGKALREVRTLLKQADEALDAHELQQYANKVDRFSQVILTKEINELLRSIRIALHKKTPHTSITEALISKLHQLTGQKHE